MSIWLVANCRKMAFGRLNFHFKNTCQTTRPNNIWCKPNLQFSVINISHPILILQNRYVSTICFYNEERDETFFKSGFQRSQSIPLHWILNRKIFLSSVYAILRANWKEPCYLANSPTETLMSIAIWSLRAYWLMQLNRHRSLSTENSN